MTSSLVTATPIVTVRRTAVSHLDNNVYLLTSRASGQQILIDAADEPDAIAALVADAAGDADVPAPRIAVIVTTHSHPDHVRALAELAARTGAVVVAGRDDAAEITARTGVVVGRSVAHGETVGVDGVELAVIGLRGHTPGSIALAYAEPGQAVALFTGDSLFPGGVGNTWGDPDRFASLIDDVTERVFGRYGDDTVVHPGHGAPTTLGAERPHLGEWRARGW